MDTVNKFAQMLNDGKTNSLVVAQMSELDTYNVAKETRNRSLYQQWKKYNSGDYGVFSQTAAFRNLRESALKVVVNASKAKQPA